MHVPVEATSASPINMLVGASGLKNYGRRTKQSYEVTSHLNLDSLKYKAIPKIANAMIGNSLRTPVN